MTAATRTFTGKSQNKIRGLSKGLILTLFLTIVASSIVQIQFFSIMGIMIVSILLGMGWKYIMGTQKDVEIGIDFSSKHVLRLGIILMGLRLNLQQIISAGYSILIIDIIVIISTLAVMLLLGRLFQVDKQLSTLIAVGTAVCGAAAIVAVAAAIHTKKHYTALAVACIAILGTMGAIGYLIVFPWLEMSSAEYGVLVGATLHELAHVIAAAAPGDSVSLEMALMTKLGRVALLIPVVIVFGYLFSEKEEENTKRKLPVPWFIFGFLAMSVINTLHLLPEDVTQLLVNTSGYLLAIAMAGLGLSINFGDFKQAGVKPILVSVIGFMLLTALGPLLLLLFN